MMGLPTTASGSTYDNNTFGSWYSYYSAGFVQDDWRLKRKLTLNLGSRYDKDGPYHEKYGRTVNGFDTTTPNPLAPAAKAAYAKSPIPQLPVSAFQVLGGLTFARPPTTRSTRTPRTSSARAVSIRVVARADSTARR